MVLMIPFTVNIYMFPYRYFNAFDYRESPRPTGRSIMYCYVPCNSWNPAFLKVETFGPKTNSGSPALFPLYIWGKLRFWKEWVILPDTTSPYLRGRLKRRALWQAILQSQPPGTGPSSVCGNEEVWRATSSHCPMTAFQILLFWGKLGYNTERLEPPSPTSSSWLDLAL